MKTIHIGLSGGGNISQTHARAARAIPGVEIAAVCGTNAEKVARLASETGVMAYSDFGKFLAHRPMEMVAIGSPSGLHAEQGIAAAQRGLHVLTEKPIDIRTERADALIAATEKAGVKLGVCFQDRFKPDLRRLTKLLRSGIIGQPILVDARVKWYRPPEYYGGSHWRGALALDGGGALINQGVHTVDLLLWLLGDVVAVQARMVTALHRIESEDTLVATLEFANGCLGSLIATTSVYPGYPRRVELSGTLGTVILENDRIIAADLRDAQLDLSGAEAADQNPSATSATVSDIRGHQAIFEDFVRAIETNSQPACDGREAQRSLALVEAIYAACGSKRRVVLS